MFYFGSFEILPNSKKMIRFLLPAVLIWPYFNSWYYLSWLGIFFILIVILGYLLHHNGQHSQVRRIPFHKLQNMKTSNNPKYHAQREMNDTLLTFALRTGLATLVQSQIQEFIPSLFAIFNNIKKDKNLASNLSSGKDVVASLLNENMGLIVPIISTWISNMKAIQLHELIIDGWLNLLKEHIKNYRLMKQIGRAHV